MRTNKGFSLIELMIVVAILAAIASIGVPSYTKHVQKGYRADAMADLESLLVAQQEYFLENQTYTTTLGVGGLNLQLDGGKVYAADKRYDISFERCDNPVDGTAMPINQCVEVVAEAQDNQVADGDLHANTIGLKQRIVTVGGTTKVYESFK